MLTKGSSGKHPGRMKDFALCFAISAAVVLYLVVGTLAGLSFAWIILPIQTAFVFGYFIAVSRRSWSRSFWFLTAILFLIHIAVVPATYRAYNNHVDHGSAWVFALGSFCEVALFIFARERTDGNLKA